MAESGSNLSLKVVNVPILILHAEDDRILNFEMGKKLYSTLKSEGKNIFFKGFSSKLGYGHKHIIRYPELPNLIKEFTMGALTQKLMGQPMCLQCN